VVAVGLGDEVALDEFAAEVPGGGAGLDEVQAAGADVAVEFASAEDPVGGDGDVGEGIEGDGPGDGALGGAHAHDGVDGSEGAGEVAEEDEESDPPAAVLAERFGPACRLGMAGEPGSKGCAQIHGARSRQPGAMQAGGFRAGGSEGLVKGTGERGLI
jgi:hypothetical protein